MRRILQKCAIKKKEEQGSIDGFAKIGVAKDLFEQAQGLPSAHLDGQV